MRRIILALALLAFCRGAEAQQVGFYLPSTKPANPAATASTTFVQMGIGGTCWFQQQTSGRFTLAVMGQTANTGNGSTTKVQLSYGTGTPPANGAAATGTVLTNFVSNVANGANGAEPFTLVGQIGPNVIVPNTVYWFDLQIAAPSGTGSVASLTCTADED